MPDSLRSGFFIIGVKQRADRAVGGVLSTAQGTELLALGDGPNQEASKPVIIPSGHYVDGDQDILRKPEEMGKPNNKIVLNFARKIIDFGTSYIVSNPIRYTANEDGEEIDEYIKKL